MHGAAHQGRSTVIHYLPVTIVQNQCSRSATPAAHPMARGTSGCSSGHLTLAEVRDAANSDYQRVHRTACVDCQQRCLLAGALRRTRGGANGQRKTEHAARQTCQPVAVELLVRAEFRASGQALGHAAQAHISCIPLSVRHSWANLDDVCPSTRGQPGGHDLPDVARDVHHRVVGRSGSLSSSGALRRSRRARHQEEARSVRGHG